MLTNNKRVISRIYWFFIDKKNLPTNKFIGVVIKDLPLFYFENFRENDK
jgi:hypothetical protein